jgi:glc operon protein GlcG
MNPFAAATSTVTLAGAEAVIAAARIEATNRGVNVAIAVLDRGGHVVAQVRMDGIHVATVPVSFAKAKTAVAYNRPTSALATAFAGGATALATLPDLVPLPGGVPLTTAAGLAGAVGVSGAAPDVDEAIAKAGAAAFSEGPGA